MLIGSVVLRPLTVCPSVKIANSVLIRDGCSTFYDVHIYGTEKNKRVVYTNVLFAVAGDNVYKGGGGLPGFA